MGQHLLLIIVNFTSINQLFGVHEVIDIWNIYGNLTNIHLGMISLNGMVFVETFHEKSTGFEAQMWRAVTAVIPSPESLADWIILSRG